MDSVFGFEGADFVLLCADRTSARSIVAFKHDEDKVRGCLRPCPPPFYFLPFPSNPLPFPSLQIRTLDKFKIAASAGPQADCSSFVELIQRNISLTAFRTGLTMSTKSVASYIKTTLAEALRKNPYQVNLLVAGYDKDTASSLFYCDSYGALAKMPFAAHGYAGYFLFSTMDAAWKPGMSKAEALDLARLCIAELAKRFTIHQPNFTVKLVGKDGVEEVSLGPNAPATP